MARRDEITNRPEFFQARGSSTLILTDWCEKMNPFVRIRISHGESVLPQAGFSGVKKKFFLVDLGFSAGIPNIKTDYPIQLCANYIFESRDLDGEDYYEYVSKRLPNKNLPGDLGQFHQAGMQIFIGEMLQFAILYSATPVLIFAELYNETKMIGLRDGKIEAQNNIKKALGIF